MLFSNSDRNTRTTGFGWKNEVSVLLMQNRNLSSIFSVLIVCEGLHTQDLAPQGNLWGVKRDMYPQTFGLGQIPYQNNHTRIWLCQIRFRSAAALVDFEKTQFGKTMNSQNLILGKPDSGFAGLLCIKYPFHKTVIQRKTKPRKSRFDVSMVFRKAEFA